MYNTAQPPKRRIFSNGHYSEWFSIRSGVAQGCPLSPLLFLVVAQGLKLAREMEGATGIQIGPTHHLISQFADDTSLILANTDQIEPALRGVQRWCKATCMRENVKKREGIAMGKYRLDPHFARKHKGIKWIKEGREVGGVSGHGPVGVGFGWG